MARAARPAQLARPPVNSNLIFQVIRSQGRHVSRLARGRLDVEPIRKLLSIMDAPSWDGLPRPSFARDGQGRPSHREFSDRLLATQWLALARAREPTQFVRPGWAGAAAIGQRPAPGSSAGSLGAGLLMCLAPATMLHPGCRRSVVAMMDHRGHHPHHRVVPDGVARGFPVTQDAEQAAEIRGARSSASKQFLLESRRSDRFRATLRAFREV
jgi:hypothetical protein